MSWRSTEVLSFTSWDAMASRTVLTDDVLVVAPDNTVHTAAGIQQEENGKPGVGVVAELAHGGELFLSGWVC